MVTQNTNTLTPPNTKITTQISSECSLDDILKFSEGLDVGLQRFSRIQITVFIGIIRAFWKTFTSTVFQIDFHPPKSLQSFIGTLSNFLYIFLNSFSTELGLYFRLFHVTFWSVKIILFCWVAWAWPCPFKVARLSFQGALLLISERELWRNCYTFSEITRIHTLEIDQRFS